MLVELRALTRDYGRRRALRDVTLDIAPGEIFGLLGPNGSGKSTLLRILAGLLVPSAGTARIAGHDVVRDGAEARRLIGYVPEDVTLYPTLRVGEFLRFMGKLRALPAVRLASAVDEVLARLALGAVRDRLIGHLSHGYRQRVLLAQALLHAPPLLILDEPGNGLDPRQMIDLRNLLGSLGSRHTILVTSHVLGEIERVATRVGILRDGRLLDDCRLRRGDWRVLRAVPPAGSTLHGLLVSVPGLAIEPLAPPAPRQAAAGGNAPGREESITVQLLTEGALAALSTRLAATGCEVRELRPAGQELEARYLALTDGGAS